MKNILEKCNFLKFQKKKKKNWIALSLQNWIYNQKTSNK